MGTGEEVGVLHLGQPGDGARGLHVSKLARAVTAPRVDLEDTHKFIVKKSEKISQV